MLSQKIFEIRAAIDAAEVKTNQDIMALEEGSARRKLKYLLKMYVELNQKLADYEDILIELEDFEEAQKLNLEN